MAEKKAPGIWVVDPSIVRHTDLELFDSEILADVEIKCDYHTWKLHQAILCTRSIWFKKALMGPFKESDTRVVTLEEQEHCDIDCFLKFIYTGSIDLQKSYPGDDAFVALMRIWKTANFFQQEALCNLAVCAANDYAQEHARILCTAFAGDDHDEDMDGIMKNSFNPAVSLLYSKEMGHLKATFLPIYMAMAVASVHRLSENEAFRVLLVDFPQFAKDWAFTLMRGFNIWGPARLARVGHLCHECGKPFGEGTVNSLKWVRYSRLVVLCDQCYRMPALGDWGADS